MTHVGVRAALRSRQARIRRWLGIWVTLPLLATSLGGVTSVSQAAPTTPSGGTKVGAQLQGPQRAIEITEPGTVIANQKIEGTIWVRANDVKIQSSTIRGGGYHAIRLDRQVTGLVIEGTHIQCLDSRRTVGVAFGSFSAKQVRIDGCRLPFAADGPSSIVQSTVDGQPFTQTPPATPVQRPIVPGLTAEEQIAHQAGFPTSATTGVRATVRGALTESASISTAKNEEGTTIERVLVLGQIQINANNTTIRNVKVMPRGGHSAIKISPGVTGTVLEDIEIDGHLGGFGPAISGSHYTVRRANIHHVYEGPRLGSGVTVEKSYIHHLLMCDSCHVDALQSTGGVGIAVRGNNIQAYNPVTKIHANAAFQFGTEQGVLNKCVVEGNLLNGGGYVLNGGGGKTTDSEVLFKNNKFQRDFKFGTRANLGPKVNFGASNTFLDDGSPA